DECAGCQVCAVLEPVGGSLNPRLEISTNPTVGESSRRRCDGYTSGTRNISERCGFAVSDVARSHGNRSLQTFAENAYRYRLLLPRVSRSWANCNHAPSQ